MSKKGATKPDEVDSPAGSDLGELARRYGGALNRFLSRRMADASQVPDVAQEVYLGMLKMRDLSHVEDPERYLFRVAINALHDHRRRDRVRVAAERGGTLWLEGLAPVLPDRELIDRETLAMLDRAIRALPEDIRTVFVLRAIEGMRCVDIAALIGVTKRAVEKRYVRALRAVNARMNGQREP
jgi:RNA polymerase sigma-70 factor (ECF subfamily)